MVLLHTGTLTQPVLSVVRQRQGSKPEQLSCALQVALVSPASQALSPLLWELPRGARWAFMVDQSPPHGTVRAFEQRQKVDRWVTMPHRTLGLQGCLQKSTMPIRCGLSQRKGHPFMNWRWYLDSRTLAARALQKCTGCQVNYQGRDTRAPDSVSQEIPLNQSSQPLSFPWAWVSLHVFVQ